METTLLLIEATKAHVPEIMTWFPTEHSCRVWGGPEFRFPMTVETFLADSKLLSLASYALIRESAELCGFGQFYLRIGRCHLSRLAVAPAHRGQGFGTQLIEMLPVGGPCNTAESTHFRGNVFHRRIIYCGVECLAIGATMSADRRRSGTVPDKGHRGRKTS